MPRPGSLWVAWGLLDDLRLLRQEAAGAHAPPRARTRKETPVKLRDSLVVALGLLVPFTAQAATSVGVSINIGNAPPPPAMVVREEPELVLVPNSSVYVCDDDRIGYDTFRYGVYWYIYNDGYWYRAHRWGGPFRAIEVRY